MYSLATAAAACGVSKSVILRAMIAGKISGSKDKHVEPAPRYAAPPDAKALAEAHQRFFLAEKRLLSHLKVMFAEKRLSGDVL